MKRLKRLFLIFSFILTIVISTSVSAEKTTYKAGIINDYSFSGNDISTASLGINLGSVVIIVLPPAD